MLMPTHPTSLGDSYRAAGWWGAPQHIGAIDRVAAHEPDRIAVIDAGGQRTYAQLDEAVRRARVRLRRAGVRAGDAVVIIAPNWYESVVAYRAVLDEGAIAAPLSIHARESEIRHAARVSRARLVVHPGPQKFDFGQVVTSMMGDGSLDAELVLTATRAASGSELLDAPTTHDGPASRPDDLAVIVFTSGTTNEPKAVLHTHNTVARAAAMNQRALELDADDRNFVPSPIAHITGLLQGMHMPFDQAGSVLLEESWQPDRALQSIQHHGATFMGGATVFLQGLLGAAVRAKQSLNLRRLMTGGAPIPSDLIQLALEKFQITVVRGYGSSECPCLSFSVLGEDPEVTASWDGTLVEGAEIDLVDRVGATGEMWARAPSMAQGYADASMNEAAYRDDWFGMGDLVDVDGQRLRVVGRTKDMAIRKGENISLLEVDVALAGWSLVSDVGCFVLPDTETGERVAVAVVAAGPARPDLQAMADHVRQRGLALQKVPEQLFVWDCPLPRTSSGKLDRKALATTSVGRASERAVRLR